MGAPRGWNEVHAFYGNPYPLVRDDGTVAGAWASQMVLVPLPTSLPLGWAPDKRASSARVHMKIAEELAATFEALVEEGLWKYLKTYDGGYTWRPQRGSSKLSLHSYGAALDFNAGTNRLGTQGNMSSKVVELFERRDWTWGGRWRRPDPMHFQYAKGV